MPLVPAMFALSCQRHVARGAGPRAVAYLPEEAELLVAKNGLECWAEHQGSWRRVFCATDDSLKPPYFSLAVGAGSVAVGGGAGRSCSIFAVTGELLTTLQGHTGSETT